jgi:hypothetical protein
LTCVCRFAEYLSYVPCLTQAKDGLSKCDLTFRLRNELLEENMKEQDMNPTNEKSLENDRELMLALCW